MSGLMLFVSFFPNARTGSEEKKENETKIIKPILCPYASREDVTSGARTPWGGSLVF